MAEQRTALPYFAREDPLKSEQDGPWQRWFVDCIQGKREVPLSLEASYRATVCCHLANVAYRLSRTAVWDADREAIQGDPEANALLDRPRRAGYELPDSGSGKG